RKHFEQNFDEQIFVPVGALAQRLNSEIIAIAVHDQRGQQVAFATPCGTPPYPAPPAFDIRPHAAAERQKIRGPREYHPGSAAAPRSATYRYRTRGPEIARAHPSAEPRPPPTRWRCVRRSDIPRGARSAAARRPAN